ncbi:hypothetical protein [Nitrosopumilus sp.]|uniref:hypothetical protein n=1 Tax=Nitrosopumilus sp. TaxID=2024843 RepID=UPI003B5B7243
MFRVFYTQKTEQLLKKMELIHWRELTKQTLEQKHQDLSDNWKTCAIGERIRRGRRPEKHQRFEPRGNKTGL